MAKDEINIFYNKIHGKWAVNAPEKVRYYKDQGDAVKKARKIAKKKGLLFRRHKSDTVIEKKYKRTGE